MYITKTDRTLQILEAFQYILKNLYLKDIYKFLLTIPSLSIRRCLMMKFRFIRTQDPEYPKEVMLRWEVLSKPLGMPPGSDIFPEEKESMHLIALEGKKVVGCVLFHPETKDEGRLYQMAVSEEYHGRGFARQLIVALEQALVKKGFKQIHLYARSDAVSFYEQMGYSQVEGTLEEKAGCMQQLMRKSITFHETGCKHESEK